MAAAVVKKRNWAFIMYPDSAPGNWLELMKQSGLPCAISPLHDKDKNPGEIENDEEKKPHWHVIVCFPGPTTYNNVHSFTKKFNATVPKGLESIAGMYRYFTHKDNPEKYQYKDSEIVLVNGFNITDYVDYKRSEILDLKLRLTSLIREKNLFEYSDFINYLVDSDLMQEFDIASSNTIYFERFIASRRNKFKEGNNKI